MFPGYLKCPFQDCSRREVIHTILVFVLQAQVFFVSLRVPKVDSWTVHQESLTDEKKSALKKIQQNTNNFKNAFVGNYGKNVLPEKHYIETIQLYCNGWTNLPHDFSNLCPEDPSNHRISPKKFQFKFHL